MRAPHENRFLHSTGKGSVLFIGQQHCVKDAGLLQTALCLKRLRTKVMTGFPFLLETEKGQMLQREVTKIFISVFSLHSDKNEHGSLLSFEGAEGTESGRSLAAQYGSLKGYRGCPASLGTRRPST